MKGAVPPPLGGPLGTPAAQSLETALLRCGECRDTQNTKPRKENKHVIRDTGEALARSYS